MWQALYDFFYNIFQYIVYNPIDDLDVGEYVVNIGRYVNSQQVTSTATGVTTTTYNYGYAFTCSLPEYLSLICSLISLIFIVVLCCLFVYKIIKLVGNLIR